MFNKNNNEPTAAKTAAGAAGGNGAAPKDKGVVRDSRKAQRFFVHAQTMADARNFDYAIELYVQGLKHDPDNLNKHEALHEVARIRKVAGGRPPGMTERMKLPPRDPIDRFLMEESLWAKDPLNLQRTLRAMGRAVEAHVKQDQFNLGEVALWIGELVLDKGETSKPPSKDELLKLRDLFERIGAFEKAAAANRLAMQFDPENEELENAQRDLDAEVAMQKGNYAAAAQASVRDVDKQHELMAEDQIQKTVSAADAIIARRRADYEGDPQDLDKLQKLILALIDRDSNEHDDEAYKLAQTAFEQTSQARYKVQMGDLRIRKLNRALKPLKAKLDANRQDPEALEAYQAALMAKLRFELEEYQERVKNYPTDLRYKFELGRRLFDAKKYDDAISYFQQSKSDPKFRPASHHYLGLCYITQDWLDEAIDTLRQGIEQHTTDDDRLAKELRWTLMIALYRSAAKTHSLEQARESLKIASQILQTDIKFRDIKERMEKIRALVKALQDQQNKPPTGSGEA